MSTRTAEAHSPARVIRVASLPAEHVYVRHISHPDGDDGVIRLPEPFRGGPAGASWYPSPMLDLTIRDPALDLPALAEQYPDASRVLVRYRLHFRPGRDDLDAVLARIEEIFPRWHDREIVEDGAEGARGEDVARDGQDLIRLDRLGAELLDHAF